MVRSESQEFVFQTGFPGELYVADPGTTFSHYFLTACYEGKKTQMLTFFFHSNLPLE